ncbi:MAG: polysaccharide deacetylase family protein, partial [Anaerolineae bacterium]|nr:polysaccharide deacetylase family protein [Anaerolineae bacterium]
MGLRRVLRQIIPGPVRRTGWRGYYYARYGLWKVMTEVRTLERVVALTFDDGPNPDHTPPILDILAHYQVKATFFLIGRAVVSHPEVAREIVGRGHTVGNHTFTHRRLVNCHPVVVARELSQCRKAMQEITGVRPIFMRPPFGAYDPISYLVARMMGYAIAHWSVSGEDWQGDPAPVVADRILADVRPGGIILLHDGWGPEHQQTEWQPKHGLLKD